MSTPTFTRFNREILASITFEPPQKKSRGPHPTPPTSSSGETADTGSVTGNVDDRPGAENQTRTIIECMKLALSKSIANISLPNKDRPLDPRKDFTIASSIAFKKQRRSRSDEEEASGGLCCFSGARAVRQPPINATSPYAPRMVGVNEATAPAYSVADSTSKEGRGSGLADGDDDDEELDGGVSESNPPVPFTFTDYSPMCYRHIRGFFGIDAVNYRQVLCQSTWHSVPTPGKSSAQLFFCGQNWVIKTMTKQESDFLRDILHKYYYHVRDNPYTLLPHFVGHHLIELNGKEITFVIMQNVFATANKIHEKFDLKGSTVGRFATKVEKLKQTCTQKDLDINRPILIGHKRRQLLVEQLKKDCDFLKRSSIMDYSLLVGIHIKSGRRRATPAATGGSGSVTGGGVVAPDDVDLDLIDEEGVQASVDGRCFTADEGGMLSCEDFNGRREIYYIGIIDVLQQYTLWKRSETIVQGLRFDSQQISSVHPTDYAARFLSFMCSLLV